MEIGNDQIKKIVDKFFFMYNFVLILTLNSNTMKTITLLTVLLFTLSLQAQISINSNNFVGVGKVIEQASDWDPDASIAPGQAGANQTWDFSALSVDDISTTLTMNPDWTPYGMYFPNSNLVMFSTDDSMYMYMEINTSQLRAVGIYTIVFDSIELPIVYNPPLLIAEFPVQYLNHKDSDASFSFKMPVSGYPGVDSARMKMDIFTQTDVDAWGTITTPLGTFEALRVYTYQEAYDSIWFKAMGYWMLYIAEKDVSDNYAWWTDDDAAGYPLVEMTYFPAQDSVGDITFLNASPTQSIEKTTAPSMLAVYPNPSDTYINFDFSGESDARLEIFDNTGKLIFVNSLNAKENNKFSIEKYQPGIYFYNVIGERGEFLNSGKFCKR